MLEESLRRRLEALNRQQLPAKAAKAGSAKSSQVDRKPVVPHSAPIKPGGFFELGTATTTPRGEHLTIAIPLAELWPAGEGLLEARHQQIAQQPDSTDEVQQQFVQAFPSRFIGLDLETCGLGGSALFLIGIVRSSDDRLVVELLFARNYAEEAAVLWSLGERLMATDTLVTFNGKSFDWPMVGDRWRRHLLDRQKPLPTLAHYDVLHPARRRWRGTLPDCKLQTIERMVCRRSRTGDIAGHLIPGAYDHYVHTGQTSEMEQVLYHNAVDLVTMLDVAMRLAG